MERCGIHPVFPSLPKRLRHDVEYHHNDHQLRDTPR
jgi:hypothetical protein